MNSSFEFNKVRCCYKSLTELTFNIEPKPNTILFLLINIIIVFSFVIGFGVHAKRKKNMKRFQAATFKLPKKPYPDRFFMVSETNTGISVPTYMHSSIRSMMYLFLWYMTINFWSFTINIFWGTFKKNIRNFWLCWTRHKVDLLKFKCMKI